MKQATITLNGFEYVCASLSARQGVRVAARLANALAPAAKALPEEGAVSPSDIAGLLTPVLTNPDLGNTLEFLIDTFAEKTIVRAAGSEEGGQPLLRVLDVRFADAYDDLIAWLVFSIQLSLSSFFRGARGLGALFAPAVQASKSPSSAAATGQSGA